MGPMSTATRFSPEMRERAVRLVVEHEAAHDSQWAVVTSIAEKIGCTAKTLRKWVRQAQRDQGRRPGLTTQERQRLKQFARENFRAAARQRDFEGGGVFCPGGARPPSEAMRRFIDVHRDAYGGRADLRRAGDRPILVLRVESAAARPIPRATCPEMALQKPQLGPGGRIALTTSVNSSELAQLSMRRARRAEAVEISAFFHVAQQDEQLSRQIQRVWHDQREVYGVRKVWRHLRREGEPTLDRLFTGMGSPQTMVTPAGFEPAISTLKGSRPWPG